MFYISTRNLSIRIDQSIKNQAEEIFNELGINMTTTVNIVYPFKLKLDMPNKTTIEAIEKGRRLLSEPTTPKYSSIDELKAALDI